MSPLEEIGLELEQLAATAHRAFALAMGLDPDGEVHPAWGAVARHVAALCEADDDVQLSFSQLAQMLRREFIRADSDDDFAGAPGWEALTRQHQLAWLAVARHLMNVMSGEITRQLGLHEQQIADWAKGQLEPKPATAAAPPPKPVPQPAPAPQPAAPDSPPDAVQMFLAPVTFNCF